MNLKKIPGGRTANPREIESYAEEHRRLLEEQFRLYKPDITLAGGTFDILVGLRGVPVIRDKDKCFPYFHDHDLGVCIDFYHPQQRHFTNACLYEFLKKQLTYHGLIN